MTKLKIIKPDDWHVHFRDGEILKKVVPETCKSFDRAIVMPNLINPIQTMKQIIDYKKTILEHARINSDFSPLMTFYITENLKKSTSVIDKQNIHQESISKSIYEVNKFLSENISLNKDIKEEIKVLSKTIANISKK